MDRPKEQEYPEPEREHEYGLHRCSTHPDVETGLGCGRCGKYICPRCMIQTPVGARCDDCAKVVKHPTFDVTPSYYLRAAVAGGVVALVSGLVWGLLLSLHIPFLPWLSAIGVGYLVGEAISVASNRKRGQGLTFVAAGSMFIAVLASGSWPSLSSPLSAIFWLLLVGIAFYMAISRVR